MNFIFAVLKEPADWRLSKGKKRKLREDELLADWGLSKGKKRKLREEELL